MKAIPRKLGLGLGLGLALALGPLAGCTAVAVSPPLSSKPVDPSRGSGWVHLTSGDFREEVEVIGVVQMTQTGYRWFYEVELNADANPNSILFKIAWLASQHGADGIQRLELVDLKPQSPGEKLEKQWSGAVRVADAAARGGTRAGLNQAANEGEETRWEVRGELVRFVRKGNRS